MVTCPVCDSQARVMATHPDGELYRCIKCTHCFSDPGIAEIPSYPAEYFEIEHQRWFAHPNTELFSKIAAQFPKDASILDAGCGRGDFLKFFRRCRPGLKLTGIDLSLNPPAEGIQFLHGDFLQTPIDDVFDAVVSLQVIEHVSDVWAFVQGLLTLTKPGGTVTVSTVNESGLLYRLALTGHRVGVPIAFNRLYSRQHLHHFTQRSLHALLERAGLDIEIDITHNAPLAAIDIPVTNPVADAILRAGMWVVCAAGEATGRSYLQTLTCRRPMRQETVDVAPSPHAACTRPEPTARLSTDESADMVRSDPSAHAAPNHAD
jgi:SAM-dependent methyltransferase